MEQGDVEQLPSGADLSPYLPVVQAAWLADDPEATWRELEGSLVFADISGFTPLTERLARRGKVGAEELTAVLNELFTLLLDTAERSGGDLLKHGGDALLLLFSGAGHAERACAASAEMQKALRAFRRYRTEAGTVSLKMSVGVASGTVQLFLVGGSHRELLAAGPLISSVVAMEAAADADEVLLDPGVVQRIPSTHVGMPKQGGHLLRGVPTPPPAPLRRTSRPGGVAGVPVGLRTHLCSGQPEGEHRVAVLTFLQFTGTDDLLATQGPAATAAALDQLVRRVQEACERHGATFLATDLDRNGGKVLLVAGAPTASADDADRTVHALLDVLQQPMALTVRAGVNRGRAFAVDVGSQVRRTFAVMGDATNLAARVMGKAQPGTVVATVDVLRNLRTDVAVTTLEPFAVKGKSVPVEAGVVGAARGRLARARSSLPLVGRDAELAVLDAGLAAALAGDGCVVELVGEPGIGKSRLVAAVQDRATERGADVVCVEGAPYAVHSPYFALRTPLRRLVGAPAGGPDDDVRIALERTVAERAPELAPWTPLLAVPLGLELPETPQTAEVDPAFRATRLRMAVAELLTRLLTRPTLLVVDDAHWLDAASTDLLLHLLQGVPTSPWLVCTTRRLAAGGLVCPPGTRTTELVLTPLSEDSTTALLRQVVKDDPVPAGVVRALAQRSGGNPLFLQELLTATRTHGDPDSLPDTVEAVLAARIDELPGEDRTLLRRAAVLGSRFTTALLGAMLDDDADLTSALERLSEFLVPQGGDVLGFRHALLREVAYEALPFRRRRALHARAGELLEERAGSDLEGWSDMLSLHYSAAQRHEPAWRFSRMAGDRARRLAGPADAVVFYERAVRAAGSLAGCDPVEVARTYESLGDACEVTAQYEKAARAYARARHLGREDALLVVELCRKEGWLRERSARYSEALRWYTKGTRRLEQLPADDAVQRARARLRLAYGIGRLRQGRYRDGIPHLEQAAREAQALDDLPTLGHAYYVLDWAHTDLGNEDCHRYRALALPIFEQLGDLNRQANVHNNLGIDAYYEGRWDEALRLYERSREAWERAGDVAQMGTAANNIGEILSDQGRWDAAATQFEEALFVWRAARFPVGIALATSNLGRLAVRVGDPAEGARQLAEARELFRDIGAESFLLEVDAREAERLVLSGAGTAALPLVEATAARARALGGLPVLLAMLDRLAGCALAQGGDRPAAVARLRTSLTRSPADFETAMTLQALARLGHGDGSGTPDDAAQGAAALLERLGVVATAPLGLGDQRASSEPGGPAQVCPVPEQRSPGSGLLRAGD